MALCALSGGSAAQSPPAAVACPPAGARVLERFTSADCVDCWSAPGQASPGQGWLFDWITPTPAGAEAAMSAAAPLASRERALRLGLPAPAGQHLLLSRSALPPPRGLRLSVQSGPAWNGYVGLQLSARGRVAAGATGWLALVERLPAGTDGSAVERQLVRTVAGPLPLIVMRPGHVLTHLSALRWPDNADPERLHARAWIEGPDGAMLAVASDRCIAAA